MSVRHEVKVRGGAAVAVAAALALTLAGCGSGGGESPKQPQKPTNTQTGASQAPKPNGGPSAVPTEILATVNGESGITLTVNAAARDAGGFLTVSGQIKNGGTAAFVGTTPWRGNELTSSGTSVAGATLVDKVGKKRYYVLRDTEGRCLCSTGIARIGAGESVPFFMQFPAPPATTTEVDFNLPTFATATVKISG